MREYLADAPSSGEEYEECNKCKLSFDSKQELEQHRKKNCYPVGKEKTVVCKKKECGEKFVGEKQLKNHMRESHAAPKLKCWEPECNANFAIAETLRKHMKNDHGILDLEKCEVKGCGQRFKKTQKLRDHMRMKHGAAPVACKHKGCSELFLNERSRAKHFRMKHGNAILCEVDGCEMKFVETAKLREHMRSTHGASKLECPECDKKLGTSQGLRLHIAKCHKTPA